MCIQLCWLLTVERMMCGASDPWEASTVATCDKVKTDKSFSAAPSWIMRELTGLDIRAALSL